MTTASRRMSKEIRTVALVRHTSAPRSSSGRGARSGGASGQMLYLRLIFGDVAVLSAENDVGARAEVPERRADAQNSDSHGVIEQRVMCRDQERRHERRIPCGAELSHFDEPHGNEKAGRQKQHKIVSAGDG